MDHTTRTYKHMDLTSRYIRDMSDEDAHRFLCHSADGSACEDGCDHEADAGRQAMYDAAFEEVAWWSLY